MPRFSRVLCAFAVAVSLGGCAYDDDYGYYGPPGRNPAYGPGPAAYGPPGYYGAYDDPCMNDPSYCNYAYYDGPVWWSGSWYGGPHRWRDGGGGREYWVHGGWHGGVRLGRGGHWGGPGRWHG